MKEVLERKFKGDVKRVVKSWELMDQDYIHKEYIEHAGTMQVRPPLAQASLRRACACPPLFRKSTGRMRRIKEAGADPYPPAGGQLLHRGAESGHFPRPLPIRMGEGYAAVPRGPSAVAHRTEGGTRRVQLEREEGRDVSS